MTELKTKTNHWSKRTNEWNWKQKQTIEVNALMNGTENKIKPLK